MGKKSYKRFSELTKQMQIKKLRDGGYSGFAIYLISFYKSVRDLRKELDVIRYILDANAKLLCICEEMLKDYENCGVNSSGFLSTNSIKFKHVLLPTMGLTKIKKKIVDLDAELGLLRKLRQEKRVKFNESRACLDDSIIKYENFLVKQEKRINKKNSLA